ncbi:hypothetical protein [Lichenicola sp.]|uniref:hypothetical protein n=1 Tax=Lichenicola sp. TaxID=2804529 RepID=UPI003AFFE53E
MPIWPVSFVDGSVQVADADGAFYPILMGGEPVRGFNPGWRARGLQTGLPPYHVLELEHDAAPSAYWMLDASLEYVSNAATLLAGAPLELYLQHVEPLVRNLFDEAIKAPHAAVPAAAHAFEGFLENNVRDLIGSVVPTVPGRPDVVSVAALDELGATYTHGGISFTPVWVSQTLRTEMVSPSSLTVRSLSNSGALVSQEKLETPNHAVFRFLDRETGMVFYLFVGGAPDDRHLYVPAASVVFNLGPAHAGYEPLTLLLIYYATHINRAVMLPEAEGLEPGLVHVVPPPQVGLDEPPIMHDPVPAEPDRVAVPDQYGERGLTPGLGDPPFKPSVAAYEAETYASQSHENAVQETGAHETGAHEAGAHEAGTSRSGAYDTGSYETGAYQAGARETGDDAQVAAGAGPVRHDRAPAAAELGSATRPLADRPVAGPKQNWWQRLLGLGEG